MMKASAIVRDFVLPLCICAALWQIASTIVPSTSMPSVVQILSATLQTLTVPTRLATLIENLGWTLGRVYSGLLLGALAGTIVGFAMARFETVENLCSPILGALYPLPKPALLPLAVMWIGVGSTAIVAVVTMSAALPMIVTTFHGIRSVPRALIWSAQSLGASRVRMVFRVLLPAALPQMIVGLRIAHNMTVVSVIAAELVVYQPGIGSMVGDFGNAGVYDFMFSSLLILVLIAATLDRLLEAVSRQVLHWHLAPEARR